MANDLFNIARGKIGYYATDALGLAGANSRIVLVVLEVSEAEDTLNNHDDLGALLAGGNTEWTAGAYARKEHAAANVTASIDDTGNTAKAVIDTDDTWTSVSGNATTDALINYDNDNAAGTDANIVPLTYHDFVVTPNGGNITADHDQTNGFWGSS